MQEKCQVKYCNVCQNILVAFQLIYRAVKFLFRVGHNENKVLQSCIESALNGSMFKFSNTLNYVSHLRDEIKYLPVQGPVRHK